MTDKFSDLLSGERLRPNWRRHIAQPILAANTDPQTGTVAEGVANDARIQIESLAARLPREAPARVFRELERVLAAQLGSQRHLFGHLLHPLRAAVLRLRKDGPEGVLHPLARAATDSVPGLIDRLDDGLSALLGVKRRAERLLERLW